MCMLTSQTFANLMFLLVSHFKMTQQEVHDFFTAIRASLRTVNAKPRTPILGNRVFLLQPTRHGLIAEVSTFTAEYLVAMVSVANGFDLLDRTRLLDRDAISVATVIAREGVLAEWRTSYNNDIYAALYSAVVMRANNEFKKLAVQYRLAVNRLQGRSLVSSLPGTVEFDLSYLGWAVDGVDPHNFDAITFIDALAFPFHDTLPTACAAWQYKQLIKNASQGAAHIEAILAVVASRILQAYFKDPERAYANLTR